MFENCHQVHFLTHYLNTTVFSYLSQSQFPTLISRAISNYYSPAATLIFLTAVAVLWCLKFDREQIHNTIGG